jgi:uncharacterized protein (DUF433 family)
MNEVQPPCLAEEASMSPDVQIVDLGRGPQLSTSRITVQDLLPYLQQRFTDAQILEIMPILTAADIRIVEQYVREHPDEVMAQDQLIRARAEARRLPVEVEGAERVARRERLAQARQSVISHIKETNGVRPAR